MNTPEDTLHFLDYWRVLRTRKEIAIAIFLLVVTTGVLVTVNLPKVYQASAVIQVKDELPIQLWMDSDRVGFDPLFLRTQFELIQSRPVIEEVVRRRDLDRKFAAAYQYEDQSPERQLERAITLLTRSLRVQQYRDTNLIEIQVLLAEPKDTAPSEAAEVANAVAQVFRDTNSERNRRRTEAALKALYDQLQEERAKVTNASLRVEEIRLRHRIDATSERGGESASLPTLGLAQLEYRVQQLRMELESRRARYQSLVDLSPEDRRDSAAFIANDPSLAALVARQREADVKHSEMVRSLLGPKHPDVVSLEASIAELNRKIDDAVKGLMTALKAEYDAAKAQHEAAVGMYEERKAQERVRSGTGYRDFNVAQEELEHARRIRDSLETRYVQEKIEMNIPRTTVELISRAQPPPFEDPVSPNFPLNIALSVLLGLAAGIGLAYFVEYLDTSVKTIDDVERFLGVPVLGVIPQRVRAFVEKGSDSSHQEAYRMLRTSVRFSDRMKGAKSLCVTSGSVGEGKSMTVFNLGFVCSELGDKVLIIDSDLHRPRQHKILGVANRPGLSNVLVGEVTLDQAIQNTRVSGLDFLPSGRVASGLHGVLDTVKFKELIGELKRRYDVLLFDAPPVIGVSDTSLLVREVDGVLLVVQHRKYPRSISTRAKGMIENLGGNLIGVVLNNINISRDYSYYYHYHYRYYPGKSKEAGA